MITRDYLFDFIILLNAGYSLLMGFVLKLAIDARLHFKPSY